MRLLFVGIKPGETLGKVLLTNGFEVATRPKFQSGETFDLVAFHPKNVGQLKTLTEIRTAMPQAWVAAVIDKKQIKDAAFVNELLRLDVKNEVWLLESWESTFWFSLQSFFGHKRVVNDRTLYQQECESLKRQINELSSRSNHLLQQFERDVGLAANIQRSILPKVSPLIPGISLAVKYVPAAGVGGDYYDIFEFGDKKRFGFLMADSKTHGLAAALLSVLLKVRLEEMKDRFPDSRSFVDFLNKEIQEVHQKDMASMSLLYGILDRSSLMFQYTVAGTIRPLLWRLGEAPPLAIAGNPPLGGVDHYAFRENIIRLMPGDLLVFHTDGLEGPFGPTPQDAILNFLKSSTPNPDPQELRNELMAKIDHQLEKEPLKDDVTLIQMAVDDRAMYLASNK